jgi:hypothetical protein
MTQKAVCCNINIARLKWLEVWTSEKCRVRINYRGISLRHNLSRKCRKIVKLVSITHSARNISNGPVDATAILREKRKPVLEGNGCLTDRTWLVGPGIGHPGHQTWQCVIYSCGV